MMMLLRTTVSATTTTATSNSSRHVFLRRYYCSGSNSQNKSISSLLISSSLRSNDRIAVSVGYVQRRMNTSIAISSSSSVFLNQWNSFQSIHKQQPLLPKQQQYHQHCYFSTSGTNSNNDDNDEEILLYQRYYVNKDNIEKNKDGTPVVTSSSIKKDDDRALAIMRSGFFFSWFHTAYWIWYTIDFVPAINASIDATFHVNTSIGPIGMAFATAINIVFLILPRRMVTKITWKPQQQQIDVYTHSLFPWIRPGTVPQTTFPTGTALSGSNSTSLNNTTSSVVGATPDDLSVFDKTEFEKTTKQKEPPAATTKETTKEDKLKHRPLLDPVLPQSKYIINELSGDLLKFGAGTVPMGYRWPYYLLDLYRTENIREPELYVRNETRATLFVS